MPLVRRANLIRPRQLLVGLLGSLIALMWVAAQAIASVAYPVDLKSCVREAGFAFAGTVIGVRSEKVPKTIVTRIVFSDLTFAKGRSTADTLVLTMNGGQIGKQGVSVTPPLPKFNLGLRYIVLAKSDLGSLADGYLPIVYFNQGVFGLEAERPGGRLVVGGTSNPVIGYRKGHLVFADKMNSPRRSYMLGSIDGKVAGEVVATDSGVRFDEKRFLGLIRKIAKEQ